MPPLSFASMKPLGIRQRILLAALAPALLVVAVLGFMFSLNHTESVHLSQHHRLAAVARQLAAAAEYDVFVGNQDGLKRLLDAVCEERDIVGAAYVSKGGEWAVSSPPGLALPAPTEVIEGFPATTGTEPVNHWHRLPLQSHQIENDLFSEGQQTHRETVGHLLLKVSNASLHEEMHWLVIQAASVSAGVLILAMLLALVLSRGLIRTLGDIRKLVDGIGRGRHDLRIANSGSDELGQLAQGINRMAEEVGQTQEMLQVRVAAATAALREERDEAERASASRRRFLDAASHDLRQPVQALGLFVAQLEREAGKSPLRANIRKIGQIVHNLQRILDTLLNYSRLDGQVLDPELQPVRASQAIQQAVAELAPLAQEKRLDLRVRCTAADSWLLTDPSLLHRMLVNLIGNALRHTQQGSVLVACRRRQHHARIEVWDTGPGIAPEHQEAIFEEFVQLDNPERDAGKGLGLGLAIVRRLADLLNHALLMRSRVGHGSYFALQIPLAEHRMESEDAFEERSRILVVAPSGEAGSQVLSLLERWDFHTEQIGEATGLKDWISRHGVPDCLISQTATESAVLAQLDRLEADTGLVVPTLLLGNGAGATPAERESRVRLDTPFQPAHLRALISHLIGS